MAAISAVKNQYISRVLPTCVDALDHPSDLPV